MMALCTCCGSANRPTSERSRVSSAGRERKVLNERAAAMVEQPSLKNAKTVAQSSEKNPRMVADDSGLLHLAPRLARLVDFLVGALDHFLVFGASRSVAGHGCFTSGGWRVHQCSVASRAPRLRVLRALERFAVRRPLAAGRSEARSLPAAPPSSPLRRESTAPPLAGRPLPHRARARRAAAWRRCTSPRTCGTAARSRSRCCTPSSPPCSAPSGS